MIQAPAPPTTLVLGDPGLREVVAAVLEGTGPGRAVAEPADARSGGGMSSAVAESGASQAVVVGTAAEKLLQEMDGPCVDGVPLGLIPMSSGPACGPWLDAVGWRAASGTPAPRVEILAMWKPFYLEWAQRFLVGLNGGGPAGSGHVRASTADRVDRAELCHRLAEGPDLAIYLGHGRGRGWSGYRGLRFTHVEAVSPFEPVGVLLSLTCKTLASERGHPSFGRRWIESGRACAVLGAVDAVDIEPLEEIAGVLLTLLGEGRSATVGDLVAEVDRRLRSHGSAAALDNWGRFRLLGDPGQPIGRFGPARGAG